jgi:putative endonuclease
MQDFGVINQANSSKKIHNFSQRLTSLWLGLKNMYSVYILKSLKNNKRYVGYTGKDVLMRLSEHNSGSNKFTRDNLPFILLHSEQFSDKTEAILREKFLKSGQGRKLLDGMHP